MLKYLLIQLSDASTSFCHYSVPKESDRVINISDLRAAMVFAMKENLHPHFLMPDFQLPVIIEKEIEKYDSIVIASIHSFYSPIASIVVYTTIDSYNTSVPSSEGVDLLLLPINEVPSLDRIDISRLSRSSRFNIVLQGVEGSDYYEDFSSYKKGLKLLSAQLETLYKNGGETQINLLTDIFFAKEMRNCNAGIESISVAPNGSLYLCPAFYLNSPKDAIGTPDSGHNIKNRQLLNLDHAPICSRCDAFHCHRCIWLNGVLTNELNTPSRQQCVLSHLERDQSRELLSHIRKLDPDFAQGKHLKKLSYLDPIELIKQSL